MEIVNVLIQKLRYLAQTMEIILRTKRTQDHVQLYYLASLSMLPLPSIEYLDHLSYWKKFFAFLVNALRPLRINLIGGPEGPHQLDNYYLCS
jgi:hypothetical protein